MIQPFSITGIGSLPHQDPEEACRLVIQAFDIPFWPQLPRISFREWMVPQYSEGMPFIHVDETNERIIVKRDASDELDRFYEACTEDFRIAISEDYAVGLHTFLKSLRGRRFPVVKGQVTGPLTFTLSLKDGEGRLVYFDEELREVSLMLLKAKTRWQIDQLKPHANNVMIFIDEPILSAIGSSVYLGVNREETLRLLRETVAVIRDLGAISGIHCCGNADWPLVIESGIEVLNFDAYDYFDNLSIYHAEVRSFLERGGYLAWGIVPTNDAIHEVTPQVMVGVFKERFARLSRHVPKDLLISRTLLTPSCGTGSRSVPEAIKIFQILMRLKEEVA